MNELSIDLSELELKICDLIKEFEKNHLFKVSNIHYINTSRKRGSDSLIGSTFRAVKLTIELQ